MKLEAKYIKIGSLPKGWESRKREFNLFEYMLEVFTCHHKMGLILNCLSWVYFVLVRSGGLQKSWFPGRSKVEARCLPLAYYHSTKNFRRITLFSFYLAADYEDILIQTKSTDFTLFEKKNSRTIQPKARDGC